jgi:hypothetical protein
LANCVIYRHFTRKISPSRSPGSSGGYDGGGGGVGCLRESGPGSRGPMSACDSPTDGIRAWHGGALGPSWLVPVCLMGWWGNNAKNRVSRTRSRCSLKRVAPSATQSLHFWLLSLQTSPSHTTSSILRLLPTFSSSPTLPPELQDQAPHPTPIAVLLPSLQPLPRSLSHLDLCEVSPLPLLSGTAASSRSDFPLSHHQIRRDVRPEARYVSPRHPIPSSSL